MLFGHSGSGKTILLRMIAGFVAPDAGTIQVDGQLESEPGKVLIPPALRGLGFIFQDLALWPHMTVYENIEFALKAHRVPHAQWETQMLHLLDLVGLTAHQKVSPATLSGGEQQRTSIARALAGHSVAVLMREPISNLDNDLRENQCRSILDLQARSNFTLVAVTHRRDEIHMLLARVLELTGQAF